ncbi:MAG: hypothetical protein OEZ34_14335, partial [Spirochaetia bacterium]|nr:hypothetical protein [Spirochaetia bacterium]
GAIIQKAKSLENNKKNKSAKIYLIGKLKGAFTPIFPKKIYAVSGFSFAAIFIVIIPLFLIGRYSDFNFIQEKLTEKEIPPGYLDLDKAPDSAVTQDKNFWNIQQESNRRDFTISDQTEREETDRVYKDEINEKSGGLSRNRPVQDRLTIENNKNFITEESKTEKSTNEIQKKTFRGTGFTPENFAKEGIYGFIKLKNTSKWNRLLEYRLNLSLESSDVLQTRNDIVKISETYGYLASSSLQIHEGRANLHTVIFVKSSDLNSYLLEIEKTGKILSETISTVDHTENYVRQNIQAKREYLRMKRRSRALRGGAQA